MPVIAGEKPENERFPGAVNTYSIEAMMQDGKALQAGTSHFLGTHFAEAQNIRFQNEDGELAYCNTTSWGVSTRLIGGVIMTHGDDDGLRLPPAVAPRQVVVVPMLRDKPEDAQVLEYCQRPGRALRGLPAFGQPLRVLLDTQEIKSAEKRWNWVRRGAPIIVEIGAARRRSGKVTLHAPRRSARRRQGQVAGPAARCDSSRRFPPCSPRSRKNFVQRSQSPARRNIKTDITTFDALAEYFGAGGEDEDSVEFKGWVRASWSKPGGAELDAIDTRLKTLKLTLRNAPLNQPKSFGACIFTGKPGVEEVLISRAY